MENLNLRVNQQETLHEISKCMNNLERFVPKGSSETTREAFCFNLYMKHKPLHIKRLNKRFLQWFIGFSEGDCTFHSWFDGKTKRAGFSIDQKDPKVLQGIRKSLGFGRVLPCRDHWRFQVWDRDNLQRLYCLFAGNIVLDRRHLSFQKWTTFLSFSADFSPPLASSRRIGANRFNGSEAIDLENGWLAGFLQADGGFHAYVHPSITNIILKVYITQWAEEAALEKIALEIAGGKKGLSLLSNSRSERLYNRLEFASESSLQKIMSYLSRYKLSGEKGVNFLRWKRVYGMREKIRSKEIPMSEKSIRKLKRLIDSTKTTK